MRYYEFHSDGKGKDALILWYIEHQPDGNVRPWSISPAADRAGYDQGKRLWIANARRPGTGAEIFERAAAFLQGADQPLAEEILLAGRRAYPADARWSGLLGQHYAMALLGSAEPGTEFNVIRAFNVSEADGSYARTTREKLEHSSESSILAQTAQWLTIWGRGPNGRVPSATLSLAESFVLRAVSLDPSNVAADTIRFRVLRAKETEKLMDVPKLSPAQESRLDYVDRLSLGGLEMERAWSPSGRNPDFHLAEAKARELLDLARRVPGAAHSAYAMFAADMMLGKVALRQNHRREAVNDLIAAADAPPSDELRHIAMPMNLPRALVDWGERDAVAQFLDSIASKTVRANEFRAWAEQLRSGRNPDMRPIVVGCSREPC